MPPSIKSSAILIITILLILAIFFPLSSVIRPAVAQEEDPGSTPRESMHRETDMLNFIGADPRDPIVVPGAVGQGLMEADRAQAILAVYAPAFGVEYPDADLALMRANEGERRSSRRYQQMYQGVPVFGGELILNMDDRGRMLSMGGEVSPDLTLSTRPGLTKEQAPKVLCRSQPANIG